MSLNDRLPRGTIGQEGESPLATSRWATPDEIAAYAYEPGDLYLGTLLVPSAEAAREIETLRHQQNEISIDTGRDADDRRREIDAIEEEIIALSETDTLDVGIQDDRHHLLVGGSRAGKTRTVLGPILQRYPGSVVVNDPKAELARSTAKLRSAPVSEGGLGQTCHVLDPYGVSKLPLEQRDTMNPMDLVNNEDEQAIDVAASIADMMTVRTNPENEHFDDSSRMLLQGLTLYVADAHAGKATRNLITVRDYLMRGAPLEMARDRNGPPQQDDPTAFEYLLGLMRRSKAFDGEVAGAAESLLSMGDRERGSVLSTARRSMEFLGRRPMRRTFASSSFDLASAKTDPDGVTIYNCLPTHRMHDCKRFMRLVNGLLMERIYEIDEPPATGHPVLAMLEEFPVLGHMAVLEQAAGYAAGFGLKMLIVVQDLTQLQRHYREGWETFVGNAGCIQAFGNNDQTTLEYLSKKLGECQVTQVTHNVSTASASSTNDPSAQAQVQGLMAARGDAAILTAPLGLLADDAATGTSLSTTESWNTQVMRAPLLLPDELQRMLRREDGTQLVLINGEPPMLMRRSK
ncbi:MAG: type IV secretory system conjugative DNA transfer family protein [Pseudomonadota bacterium]